MLSRLETDVKVLNYGLDSRKQQVLSDAVALAQREEFVSLVSQEDKVALATHVQKFLLSKSLSSLIVVDKDGQVLARGEDKERLGDSLSSDVLVRRGLADQEVVSVVVKDGALAPEVLVRAVVPIIFEGNNIGAVITGLKIDNTFVDGIKAATGLEAAVYGHEVLAATTQVSADGKSRWVGTKEQATVVRSTVLEKGESFSGALNILNTPYFVSYIPLKDIDNVVVGMLFVGRPQVTVLAAASRSIEITFILTAGLVVIAIIPAYLISRFIANQLS